jgi:hypothetical protein
VRLALRLALVTLLVAAAACSDGAPDKGAKSSTSSTAASGSTSTTELAAANDPALRPLLIESSDLPAGFARAADVDRTVTTFCAGEDAAAGLQASGRALVGFTRTPAGASVVHVVFRFKDDGASAFVQQAKALLARCSNVPDATGLAFAYEAATPSVDAVLADTEGHVTGHGTSAGSGKLAIDLAVFRKGDLGELIAALTVDQDRAATDTIALAAFTAAVANLADA